MSYFLSLFDHLQRDPGFFPWPQIFMDPFEVFWAYLSWWAPCISCCRWWNAWTVEWTVEFFRIYIGWILEMKLLSCDYWLENGQRQCKKWKMKLGKKHTHTQLTMSSHWVIKPMMMRIARKRRAVDWALLGCCLSIILDGSDKICFVLINVWSLTSDWLCCVQWIFSSVFDFCSPRTHT